MIDETTKFNRAKGYYNRVALAGNTDGAFKELVAFNKKADDLKNIMNEKYGPGTVKYGSEIKQPEIKTPQAIFEFSQRNPAAEGGRIAFGDGSITQVRNKSKNIVGKNLKLLEEGKLYHLRLGADKKVYFGTEKELKTIFKNRKTSGGDVMARLEDVKDPEGFLTQKQFQEFLKKNNINAESSGSSFAKNHGVNTKVNPLQKNALLYDTSQFTEEFINKVQKAQVKSGVGTEFARNKFPPLTNTEKNKPRLDAIEEGGGVKKNDPYAGKRGSGIELGHTGNIFGTELITGDKLSYTPTEINQLMGDKGKLDDKIRSVSAKIEKIKGSNKPANVVKDLLEQADNILIRLASQSQGFKKVTLSGGGTFGGDRLTIDPFNTYPEKTEKEIQKIQKKYLGKKIITEGPNKTPPEEIQKIQDAFFFEKNRKEVMKTSKKIGKKEIKKIKENIDIDFIDGKGGTTLSSGFNTDLFMKDPAIQKIVNSEVGQKIANNLKKTARGTTGTLGKVFGVADILIGVLDYQNNISKNESPKVAFKNALQAASINIYKGGDRAVINEVKERFVKQGGDGKIFDQAIGLNKKDQEINDLIFANKKKADTFVQYAKAGRGTLTPNEENYKADYEVLKKNLNAEIAEKMSERDNMIESYKTNLQVSEAGAPIQIGGSDFFGQPFKDIKRSTMDRIEEQNKGSYDMQKRQVNYMSGNIGNWMLNNLITMSAQEKTELQKQINNMDERELYKFNLQRGMDPDNLIRFEDVLRYKTQFPELMGVNTTKYVNYDEKKAEGGITGLRSKYEYKK